MQNLFRPMEDRLIERKSLVLGSENRRGKGGQHRSVAFGALTSPGNTVEVVVSTEATLTRAAQSPSSSPQTEALTKPRRILSSLVSDRLHREPLRIDCALSMGHR